MFFNDLSKYLDTRNDNLLVSDCGSPNCQTECQFVDEIGNVVHNVDHALVMVGGGRSEQSQVISERVDAPSYGDDQAKGVECLLGRLVSRSSTDLSALACEHLVNESQPEQNTRDETAEHGNNTGFTGVTARQHKGGFSQQSVEETGTQVWQDGLQDEVELNNLQRNSDQPIRVTVDCW